MSSASSLNPFSCMSPILSEISDGSHIPSSADAVKDAAASTGRAAVAMISLSRFISIGTELCFSLKCMIITANIII